MAAPSGSASAFPARTRFPQRGQVLRSPAGTVASQREAVRGKASFRRISG